MVRVSPQAVFPDSAWFEAWKVAVTGDRELSVFGRWCNIGFAIEVGEEVFLVRLREGAVSEVVVEPNTKDLWSFTLVGSPEDWTTFLQQTPPPFYHDLLAMNVRVPTFSIEGDQHTFVQHLRTMKHIFRIAQTLGACID